MLTMINIWLQKDWFMILSYNYVGKFEQFTKIPKIELMFLWFYVKKGHFSRLKKFIFFAVCGYDYNRLHEND